jgi:hypothetical protein
MDLRGIGCGGVNWIQLAEDFVNRLMMLHVP